MNNLFWFCIFNLCPAPSTASLKQNKLTTFKQRKYSYTYLIKQKMQLYTIVPPFHQTETSFAKCIFGATTVLGNLRNYMI